MIKSKLLPNGYKSNLRDLRLEFGYSSAEKFVDYLNNVEGISIKLRSYSSYERDEVLPPISLAIKLADLYGVTLDYLLGRSCCRSVDNEYIHQQLGLSDNAINQLKGFKAHDEMFKFTSAAIEKDYSFLGSYDLRLPFINCLITSSKLRPLINTMFLYILPDKFKRLVVKFNDLQLTEIPADKLFLSTEKDLTDNVPFEMDSFTRKTFFQQKLWNILDEVSKDYKKSLGQQDTKNFQR